MPLFGRLFDRSTPHRMGAWIFLILALYPLLLIASGRAGGSLRLILVYAAFALFGTVMSALTVVWQLSSLRFAGDEDVGIYQSAHVAMTGIRGSFAPLLGYAVMNFFGKSAAMMCAAALWVVAAVAMVVIRRIDLKTGAFRPLRAGAGR
jgi:hypothetical protein